MQRDNIYDFNTKSEDRKMKYAITNCTFCLKDEWEGLHTYLCKEDMKKCEEKECLLKKIVNDVSIINKLDIEEIK